VPEADHVHLDCTALRLSVNNYSVRHQIKLEVAVSAPDEDALSGVDLALLSITNPAGEDVTMACSKMSISPKRFKAAHARLLFKAVEDSAAPLPSELSNAPPGFFSSLGPYELALTLRGELFQGEISFGEPLAMRVEQESEPVANFVLRDEAGFTVSTTPQRFGPVYYKRQDMTNFVFQLANMDQALEGGDFHAPVEPMRYFFQVRVGDTAGGPTRLLDPARYIEGHKAYMIRSDETSTPLKFMAEEFVAGEVVLVDFMRINTAPPDTVFTAERENLSSLATTQERVVYALAVETPPTPEELGQLPGDPNATKPNVVD
jgi:hypothetical protein